MSDQFKRPSRLNLFREAFASLDMTGVPGALASATLTSKSRKDRLPVIVLPGLGANDLSTAPLRYFLERQGYQAEGWGLGFNLGGRGMASEINELANRWGIHRSRIYKGQAEVPTLIDLFTENVRTHAEKRGTRTALVGWSLGGVIAREAARNLPDHVAGVITMGSPVSGGAKYTSVAPVYEARGHDLDWMETQIEKRRETPITQPVTVIYSKRDGIVGWEAAIDDHSPDVTHHEVDVSHFGLGLNSKVWKIVQESLDKIEISAVGADA